MFFFGVRVFGFFWSKKPVRAQPVWQLPGVLGNTSQRIRAAGDDGPPADSGPAAPRKASCKRRMRSHAQNSAPLSQRDMSRGMFVVLKLCYI